MKFVKATKQTGAEPSKLTYFDEELGLDSFKNFCRTNGWLLITITFVLFFAYGIKLFWYSIGIDTEIFMHNKDGLYGFDWDIQIGRFGKAFLNRFLNIREFNPYSSFFLCLVFFWLFSVVWCYVLSLFNKEKGANYKLIPFAAVFMTIPVWTENFYFLFQAPEVAFTILICPFLIYFLFKGFLEENRKTIIACIISLALVTSVYQSTIILFCSGVFGCFLLFQLHSNYDKKVYNKLCLQLFVSLLIGLGLYFLIWKSLSFILFPKADKNQYFDKMFFWNKRPVNENIKVIVAYAKELCMGKSKIQTYWLLGPAFVLFIAQILYLAKKKFSGSRAVLFVLAGIGIPLTIMALPIAGAYSPPLRAQFAMPFAIAFMAYFVVLNFNKKNYAIIGSCIILFFAMHQMQVCSQLYYSDYMRYQEDVHLAYEIDRMVRPLQNENNTVPIAIIGKQRASLKYRENFLEGEIVGRSFFGLQGNWTSSTADGIAFMRSLGINYLFPGDQQMNSAREAAAEMPLYPLEGCIKRLPDVIVIHFSNDLNAF